MKKIILTITGLSLTPLSFAQAKTDSNSIMPPVPPDPEKIAHQIVNSSHFDFDRMALEVIASLAFAVLFVYFILMIIKRYMDYRLKNKIIDQGISEEVATSILQNNKESNKNETIKWALLLCGIGTGLTMVYYQLPLHIHSIAIMAFSIAASYLGYYLYLRFSNK
jgi:hypothetical protein